jgi:membrane protease YdiL (CAAX protease family)
MRAALDAPETATTFITPDHLISLAGIALFAGWLIRTSLGRKALVGAPQRRNYMAPYTPFIPFFIWLIGISLLQQIANPLVGPLEGWHEEFLTNFIFCVGAVVTIIVMMVLAQLDFVGGLRGLGFRLRTIGRDLPLAFVNLLAVWPVVLAMIIATASLGRVIQGPDFEIPQHEELRLMSESTAIPLRLLVVFLAVVVAPLLEEMLFRGLFQTMIRSYLERPWPAVIITSAIFASVHQNVTHWPALFALAMGLGYAYEKSGSLFRPIFMHALFNGAAIAATLYEQPAWI